MLYEMLTGDLPRGAWEPPGKLNSGASVRLDQVVTRAIADLDAVINELADFQPALDDYKKRGVTRYWTENEQQIQKLRLDDLFEKVRTRTAVAFARDDPRVKEAQQRLAALAGAHKAMQLPELSNGNCVSPEFRANNPAAGCYIDGEVIPGVLTGPAAARTASRGVRANRAPPSVRTKAASSSKAASATQSSTRPRARSFSEAGVWRPSCGLCI